MWLLSGATMPSDKALLGVPAEVTPDAAGEVVIIGKSAVVGGVVWEDPLRQLQVCAFYRRQLVNHLKSLAPPEVDVQMRMIKLTLTRDPEVVMGPQAELCAGCDECDALRAAARERHAAGEWLAIAEFEFDWVATGPPSGVPFANGAPGG